MKKPKYPIKCRLCPDPIFESSGHVYVHQSGNAYHLACVATYAVRNRP